MQFSVVLALAAAAVVSAGKNVTYTTEVVTEYTTYCPEPTTLTYEDKTITVTEPTVITITDCPGGCTITKPVYSTSKVVCETGCAPMPTNGTSTGYVMPTGSVEPVATETPLEAGAAKVAGAGLAAIVGLAAFAL